MRSNFNVGDLNQDGLVDPDDPATAENEAEIWQYTAPATTAISGPYINTASVTGEFTNVLGETFSASDSDSSGYFGLAPAYTVTKVAANADAARMAGDVILYTIEITNTGNVTLTGGTIADALLDSDPNGTIDLSGVDEALNVGETWTVTGSYTVQQDDIDSLGTHEPANDDDGTDLDIDNTVTVDFNEVDPPQTASEDVPLTYNPALTIDKTAAFTDLGSGSKRNDLDGTAQIDEIIRYTFVLANEGNVTLTGVALNDEALGFDFTIDPKNLPSDWTLSSSVNDDDANLDVGETWTLTYNGYRITQNDLDNEGKYNIAFADSNETEPVDDDAFVFFTGNQRSISLDVQSDAYLCTETSDNGFVSDRVSGSTFVTDESDDGSTDYSTVISDFLTTLQDRGGNNKGKFSDRDDSELTNLWIELGGTKGVYDAGIDENLSDGIVDGLWSGSIVMLAPDDEGSLLDTNADYAVVGNSVEIGWEVMVTDRPLGHTFRAESEAQIIGRDRAFWFSDTEDFNRGDLFCFEDQLVG